MKYLLFQCYAPLVSWGMIAIGGERITHHQPRKSAIIGLIAAGLGIKREEEEKNIELNNSIGFSTKIFTSGTVLNDFHTIQYPKPKKGVVFDTRKDELEYEKSRIKTILSNREYLCDALSIVAVWIKDNEYDIKKIKQALLYPTYCIYLGRKACTPALPLNPRIFESKTIKDAFDRYDVVFPLPIDTEKSDDIVKERMSQYYKRIFKEDAVSYYWEECDHSGLEASQITKQYDVLTSRKRWQFTYREEYSTKEYPSIFNEEETENVS